MNYSQLTQLEADTTELLNKISNELETSLNAPKCSKKGRKPGQKQKKMNYSIQFYDVFQKQFIQLFEGYTFEDVSEQLNIKYNLSYTVPQLKSIYTNKNDRYIKIIHL